MVEKGYVLVNRKGLYVELYKKDKDTLECFSTKEVPTLSILPSVDKAIDYIGSANRRTASKDGFVFFGDNDRLPVGYKPITIESGEAVVIYHGLR